MDARDVDVTDEQPRNWSMGSGESLGKRMVQDVHAPRIPTSANAPPCCQILETQPLGRKL